MIFKALIDPCISPDEFMSVNIVLREYDDMKEDFMILFEVYKNRESKNPKAEKTKKEEEQCFYQDRWCVVVKNQELPKTRGTRVARFESRYAINK